MNITRRPSDTWIVDFGTDMSQDDAALFVSPFEYVVKHVKPISEKNSDKVVALNWWRHARPRIDMRIALAPMQRFIATPAVSKHRVFVFLHAAVLPDQAVLAIARADDTTFGLLHSRFHELWALRMCTWMGVGNDPRYTPTTCFDTFPFPAGLRPADTAHQRTEAVAGGALIPSDLPGDFEKNEPVAQYERVQVAIKSIAICEHAKRIVCAAKRLNDLRENYLNPALWVDWVITPEEAAAGYPKRPVAKPGFDVEVKKLTLTNLYNASPAWLRMAHEALDQAVAATYGWTDYTPDLPDDDILRRLLTLNLAIQPVAPAGDEAGKSKKKMPLAQD